MYQADSPLQVLIDRSGNNTILKKMKSLVTILKITILAGIGHYFLFHFKNCSDKLPRKK